MIHKILTYGNTFANLMWRALQTVARNGFSFAVFYLASLFLPQDTFGYYSYLLKIVFFATLFVDFGISLAVSKFAAEYDAAAPGQIKTLLAGKITAILLLSLPVAAALWLWAYLFSKDNLPYITLLLPLVALVPLTSLFDGVLRGTGRFKELAIITISTGLFSLLFFYPLISVWGLRGAFVSQILFYTCMLAGLWWRIPVRPELRSFKAVLMHSGYAVTIGIIGLFMFLSTQVDVLFLGHFGYFTEVAYYEIILRFYSLVMMPLTVIGHVLAPTFTKLYAAGQYSEVRLRLRQSILFSLAAALAVTLALYFIFPPAFSLFFSKYNTAMLNGMSRIMLILFFSGVLNGFIPLLAIATGHARLGMYFITGVGLLNVVCDYLSLSYWGVWGLVYSTVLLKSAANLLFVVYYYRRLPR